MLELVSPNAGQVKDVVKNIINIQNRVGQVDAAHTGFVSFQFFRVGIVAPNGIALFEFLQFLVCCSALPAQ